MQNGSCAILCYCHCILFLRLWELVRSGAPAHFSIELGRCVPCNLALCKVDFRLPDACLGARGAGDAWGRGMGGLEPVQRRMDLQSIGLCPQGFESSRCKTWRGRVAQHRSGAPDLGARAPSAANRVIVSAQNSGGVGARRACMHKGEGRYGAERGRERLSRSLARRPFSLAYINTHVTDTSWYTCTKLCVCT